MLFRLPTKILSWPIVFLSREPILPGATPILFRRIEAHKAKNPDVKIIVADPRRTQSCSVADLHLQLNPGTDVFLNNAIWALPD